MTRIFYSTAKMMQSGDYVGAVTFAARTLMQSPKPVSTKLRSIPIVLRPCTPDFETANVSFAGEFDDAIRAATPLKHNFIIDAGGYIGTAAIVFARAFPQATIVSIEPSRENFGILQRNVAPYRNIIPLNKALDRIAGYAVLRDRMTGGWGFSIVDSPLDHPGAMPIHTVETVTIPDLMRYFGAQGIDILKLDIEGSERDLLADRPAWIDTVEVVFAELHDRIAPGCEAAFDHAMTGRKNYRTTAQEKVLSVRGAST